MSSTIYTNINLYRIDLPESESVPNGGLFGCSEIVVLLSESHCSNDYPANPKWSISFIGTVDELADSYVVRMGELLEDGVTRFAKAGTAASFKRYIGNLYQNAEKLTAQIMNHRGYSAYSWDSEDYPLISSDGMTPFKIYGDYRYAQRLTTDLDVVNMVSQAMQIKNTRKGPKAPYNLERVWQGCPWSMDIIDIEAAETKQMAMAS